MPFLKNIRSVPFESCSKAGSEMLPRLAWLDPADQSNPQVSGVSEEELTDALESAYPLHSLSEPVCDDDNVTLEGAVPSADDGINDLCETLSLHDALKKLDPTEQKIIYLRYFRDYSQQQIADALGLSQVKVSRTEKKIYEKLRQMLTV